MSSSLLPRERSQYLKPLLFLLVILLIIRFIVVPTESYLDLMKERVEVEAQRVSLHLREGTVERRVEKGEVSSSPSGLYPSETDPFLLQLALSDYLRELARKSGLPDPVIEQLAILEGNVTYEVPLRLVLSGQTGRVLHYLSSLEEYFHRENRFLKVQEVELRPDYREGRRNLQLIYRFSVLVEKPERAHE